MEKPADSIAKDPRDPVAVTFGDVLRSHRKNAGLSQMALAERSDIDRTYVSFLERGVRQPSLKVVLRLGYALGVLPSELVREVSDVVTPKELGMQDV